MELLKLPILLAPGGISGIEEERFLNEPFGKTTEYADRRKSGIVPLCLINIRTDMGKKHFFFIKARLEPKLFYPKKCVKCNKSEFATKQRKMYLTKSMIKIRLLHIYTISNPSSVCT